MLSESKDAGNTPNTVANKLPLEARLYEEPSLDMDLIQFLVIVGFTYKWKPLYEDGNGDLLEKVWNKYEARRQKLLRQVKVLETRTSFLLNVEHKFRDMTTLMDLKNYLEKRTGKTGVRFVGALSMAYLNSALRYHGVEEIDYRSPQSQRRLQNLIPYNISP